MSRSATGYRSLLRTPGAAAFFLAAAAGRVGIAMTGLGLVWLLHARTGSYTAAGLAAGGFSGAEALVGPQLARLTDRYGQARVLPFALLAHGAAVGCVLASGTPAASIVAATCAGAFVPQLGALSAARWAHLLRGGRADELPTAFSLESLANATAYLLGPAAVTSLAAAGDATLASGTAAALILGGGGALAAQVRTAPPAGHAAPPAGNTAPPAGNTAPPAVPTAPPDGRTAPPAGRPPNGGAGTGHPLRQRAFLLVALLNLAIGLYFGATGIGISSFAVSHEVPGAAAPIMAVSGLSGLLAGWLYGQRRHAAPARRQLVVAAGYLTGAGLLLPWAPSAVWLGAAAAVTEAAVPPTLTLLTVLTEQTVPPAVLTQAFTWNNSASAAGAAGAAWLAGRAADAWGASAALALAPAAGLILLLLACAARLSDPDGPRPAGPRPAGPRPAGPRPAELHPADPRLAEPR